MSFNSKRVFITLIAGAMLLSFCSCQKLTYKDNSMEDSDKESATTLGEISNENTSNTTKDNAKEEKDDMFTDRDNDTSYKENEAVIITLDDNKTQTSDNSVKLDKNTITITKEGTYILSGSLSDGQIKVDAGEKDKIQLVFNGVDINSKTSSAVYVKSADKVFITLAENSKNKLSNSGEFENFDDSIDAVVFSKKDITFNGTGELSVTAKYGNGIASKNDLKITGGTYKIDAQNHAVSGKNSVRIANGNITLTADKDGIHSENKDDSDKGFVYISGGNINIESDGDGIDASLDVKVNGGTFNIKSGGGNQNAEQKQSEMFGGGRFDRQNSYTEQTAEEADKTSAKGIKSDGDITLNGGKLVIDSADDTIHSKANLTINDGDFNLATGDDGLHADSKTYITGGRIDITTSYEGIEGKIIEISGGHITLVSSDDGLNSAGGNDGSGFGGGMRQDEFNSGSSESYVKISGGYVSVNSNGDGLDSNGNLYVSGGEIYVDGPSDNSNASIDYENSAEITGGKIIAIGSSGMAQNFGDNSTQGSMLVNISQGKAGDEIVLTDSSGKVIMSYTAQKLYNSVVISTPDIKQGETYTLKTGDNETTIEMTELIYGSSNGMGGRPNGGMNRPMNDETEFSNRF